MSRTLGVILAFIGIFIAGGVTGGFVALRVQPSVRHQRAAERFTEQQFKRVAEELALSPEQRERIHPIITSAGHEIQERRREVLQILQRMEGDIRAQLTDEQRTRYDAFRAEQRENMRNRREQIRNRLIERREQRNSGEKSGSATAPETSTEKESETSSAPTKPGEPGN
ncbi:MAG TPA: hypothetical protein VFT72_19985 [Opitutaceae bacterium]|nr:hypothetical protein [Opitutaceae bacterium]